MSTVDDVKYESWSRKRLDRLLADYLLRHGYNESAKELAAQRKMENLVDINTFVAMSRIRDALKNGSVTEALAWCTENKKELRKMDVCLQSPPISPLAIANSARLEQTRVHATLPAVY
jgi:macrophage erythroblast attacher